MSPALNRDDGMLEPQAAYLELIAAAGNVFFTTDATGFLVHVNSAVKSVLGFSASDLIGKHFTEVVHADWLDKVIPWYTAQFRDFVPETILEFEVLSADGGRRWVEQIVRLNISDGRVQGCSGLLHDITRRKNAEDNRRNIENSFGRFGKQRCYCFHHRCRGYVVVRQSCARKGDRLSTG